MIILWLHSIYKEKSFTPNGNMDVRTTKHGEILYNLCSFSPHLLLLHEHRQDIEMETRLSFVPLVGTCIVFGIGRVESGLPLANLVASQVLISLRMTLCSWMGVRRACCFGNMWKDGWNLIKNVCG